MNTERLANRLVLRHAADVNGIPQDAGDFAQVLKRRGVEPPQAEARRSVRELETLGYLERCEATAADEALWKITAAGLRQILKNVKPDALDPMIWD